MRPIFNYYEKDLEISHRKSSHFPPHIHSFLECIHVTQGALELGIGREFYHMEKGDFAIVFPDIIHHYQIFDPRGCTSTYLLASQDLHPDVLYLLNRLLSDGKKKEPGPFDSALHLSFIQIILARCLPYYRLMEKGMLDNDDLVYQVVSYLARNFTEQVSLSSMAKALGVSPYLLSRVFSGTFHMNFNQYLNDLRLNQACIRLVHTDQAITEICLNAGFESQRTFNRVFKERFHMSPREYRSQNRISP